MTYFFDTSALVKVYHPESGTPQVLTNVVRIMRIITGWPI